MTALHPERTLAPSEADLWRRLRDGSLPLAALNRAAVEPAVKACRLKLDGTKAGANYAKRRKGTLSQVLIEAVAQELLGSNPVARFREKRSRRAVVAVDAAEVGSPGQVAKVLDVIRERNRNLWVLFTLMYLLGLRPSEAVVVRWSDFVKLPTDGSWGELRLRKSASEAGSDFTDNGEVREEGGLKARGEDETREIPVPPAACVVLREWRPAKVKRDELVCPGQDGPWSGTTLQREWKAARDQVHGGDDDRLLHRPYSLRHSCASLWFGQGVSPARIAARLGHSVKTLMSTYVNVIPGDDDVANARIEAGLAGFF